MREVRTLEDYGMRNAMTPLERKEEYIRQCKLLPRGQQAPFWLKVIHEDEEVAKLVCYKVAKPRGRKK